MEKKRGTHYPSGPDRVNAPGPLQILTVIDPLTARYTFQSSFSRLVIQRSRNSSESEAELVYPKVKVRQQQDPGDQHGVQDFYSAKEHEDVSPPSVAKIPTSYVPSVAIPSEEAEKKNEKLDEDNQQNIRASSIPRPRAVLSSPDNDLVIGNTNRIKTERRALVVKNHNSVQNRHTGCKAISSHHAEKSMNRKKSKDAQDEDNLKEGKQPVGAALNQRRQPRTQKPSSIRT